MSSTVDSSLPLSTQGNTTVDAKIKPIKFKSFFDPETTKVQNDVNTSFFPVDPYQHNKPHNMVDRYDDFDDVKKKIGKFNQLNHTYIDDPKNSYGEPN